MASLEDILEGEEAEDIDEILESNAHANRMDRGRVFPESDVVYTPEGCRADVWDHFQKCEVKGQQYKFAKCNYCHKFYVADSALHGTSGLSKHVNRCKSYLPNIEKKEKERLAKTQSKKPISPNLVSPSALWKFDQDAVRKAVAFMIVIDELPFKFVENEGFRHVMDVACPQFSMPSRRTITRDCYKLYVEEKEKLKSYFQKLSQRVCLTTDTWTSIQNVNYMVLTAHFIDKDWVLNKKILNFIPINSHAGQEIGLAIESCLKEWGIDKIFTITVDNASSNDVAVAYLKKCLTRWDQVICDNKYLHVRCVAHILNLVVKSGLEELEIQISRVRACVLWVRQSPSRLRKFWECLEMEGIKKTKSLVLDVKTRWNSTYNMLNVAQEYERVFERLGNLQPNFRKEMMDGHGWPESDDWETVRAYSRFLELFYDTTVHISGSNYVTSNLFLPEFYELECYVREKEDGLDESMQMMAMRMRIKYEKYWGDVEKMNKLLYVAVVFDPTQKFIYVERCFEAMYGKGSALSRKMIDGVKEALYEMYNFYHLKHSPVSVSHSSSSTSSQFVHASDRGATTKRLRRSAQLTKGIEFDQGNMGKSDLDKYLEEPNHGLVEDIEFDVLNWWKHNSLRFPILGEMARDVLAFPIATVASESAFSTGGRVLDQFRSSLTPRMVQALICTRDWLWRGKSIDIEERLEALEELEREFVTTSLEAVDL